MEFFRNNQENPSIPEILEIEGNARVGQDSLIRIRGHNFLPDSSVVLDESIILKNVEILNSELISLTVNPTLTGNYPITINNGGNSSNIWGSSFELFLNCIDFRHDWIDLSSTGPNLGIIESSFNEGLNLRNITNSGCIRTTLGLTKDNGIGSGRPFLLLKDYPIPKGYNFSIICADLQKKAYIPFGIYSDYKSYQYDALIGVFVSGSMRTYFYSELPGQKNSYFYSNPSNVAAFLQEGNDYLINFNHKSSTFEIEFFQINQYGQTHDENSLEKLKTFSCSIQEGAGLKSYFPGLGFWTNYTSFSTHFKAFKIS